MCIDLRADQAQVGYGQAGPVAVAAKGGEFHGPLVTFTMAIGLPSGKLT